MGLISRVSSRTYRPSKMENQSNPKIIFILGGPGSGKGTQCEKIKQKYNYDHLSTGDLLRDVVKSGSELGIKIQAIMTAGQLVSDDLILCLVKDAISKCNKNGVLIDGYPRNIEQAKLFESKIGYPDKIIYLKLDEQTMIDRLINRGKTSGRADDNMATIEKRLTVFKNQTGPVLDYYKDKLSTIDSSNGVEATFELVCKALDS